MEREVDLILQQISERFKLLADPNRLKVLHALKDGEKNVTEIMQATGLKQANVSKILNMLAWAAVVGRRKEKNNVYYSILDVSIFELCALVCRNLEGRTEEIARAFKWNNPFSESR